MYGSFVPPPLNPETVVLPRLDPDQIRATHTLSELREGPIPVVLDTSCVRTGLHFQLSTGRLPASLDNLRSGRTRMYMEAETLDETWERLPRFARQLNVATSTLEKLFANDWMPSMSIVSVSDAVRALDERAVAVHDLDPDDYPTAALAALLSPCIVLTHNYRHFRPLGVTAESQGLDAVFAAMRVRAGESHMQGIVLVPASPVIAVGATTKWAADKFGPIAWIALMVLVAGGVFAYQKQPVERKDRIKRVASEAGNLLAEQYGQATLALQQAQDELGAYVVPGPEDRSVTSAVFRKLATAGDSMSAQQLCDALDGPVRPDVDSLRKYMHANKTTVFQEVRRGSFTLGTHYRVVLPVES